MLVVQERLRLFDSWQLRYPRSAEEVLPFLSRAPVVSVLQCSDAVADALQRFTVRRERFCTLLVDLAVSEDQLWARLPRTACRKEINKARRLGCDVSVNAREEDSEEAFRLLDQHVVRKKLRPVSRAEWDGLVKAGDLFVVKLAGRMIAAHVVVVDRPLHAKPMVSATVDRQADPDKKVTGPLNRYLHWFEINYYRAQGVRYYDLGGMDFDPGSPLYSVSQFKLSLGADIVRDNSLRLARNPVLRVLLKAVVAAREMMRVGVLSSDARRVRSTGDCSESPSTATVPGSPATPERPPGSARPS